MIQAKINGKWGPVPEGILPELPDEGTIAAFEYLYSFPHAATKKRMWKNQQGIMPIVKVRNPKTRQPMEIGFVGGVDINGNPIGDSIRRVTLYPNKDQGMHTITIGNSADGDELYQFLMITSENESSPIRDEGVLPVFRTKDFVADAKKQVAQMQASHEAQGIAFNLKGQELKDAAVLLGFNPSDSPVSLVAEMAKEAAANPGKFLAMLKDEDKATKSMIAQGFSNGALLVDQEKRAIVYADGGGIVLPLTLLDRESAIEQFTAFIKAEKTGANTLKALKQYVDAKDKQAAAKSNTMMCVVTRAWGFRPPA